MNRQVRINQDSRFDTIPIGGVLVGVWWCFSGVSAVSISPPGMQSKKPDEFIVGYGVDFARRNRNFPFVGAVEFNG